MNHKLAAALMLGGFLGTIAHTLLMYLAHMAGMARVNIAGILGSPVFSDWIPPFFATHWLAGMAFHFALGVVFFPLLYALVMKKYLAKTNWLTGLLWGVFLWAGGQFLFMPAVGMFDYFMSNPTAIATYLLGHVAYGTIFGATAGRYTRKLSTPVKQREVVNVGANR